MQTLQPSLSTSYFLAQLIGPLLIVMGLTLLIDRAGMRTMAREFLSSRALIYLAGILAFVPGLAVVLGHNLWVADWRLIITLLGWLSLAAGVMRLTMTGTLERLAPTLLDSDAPLIVFGAVFALLGLVLGFVGYFG